MEQFTQLLYCRQFLAQSILGFRQQSVFFAVMFPVFVPVFEMAPLFKGWANLCRASGALGIRGDSHERDG